MYRQVKLKPGDTVFCPGDLHWPFTDEKVLWNLLQQVQKRYPNRRLHIWLLGDYLDNMALSTYPKKWLELKAEDSLIEQTQAFHRRAVKKLLKYTDQEILILDGNHEDRYARQINSNATWLAGHCHCTITGMSNWDGVRHLCGHRGIIHTPTATVWEHGHLLAGSLNKHSTYTVWERYPDQNTVYGHTHRLDITRQPHYGSDKRVTWAMSIGHCHDPNHGDFMPNNRWLQGAGLVHIERGRATPELIYV